MERGGARRRGAVAVGLIALLIAVVGIAGVAAGRGRSAPRGEGVELKARGNFGPRVPPSPKQAPIRLGAALRIVDRAAPEGHPPAIRKILIESADLEIHTKGIPVCRLGQLEATEARVAEKACGPALIGAGSATAQVRFLEQKPLDVRAELLVFNGGTEDRKTTLFIHTYFPTPISGAIDTTVTATDLKGAHFGTFAVAHLPPIAGGAGSITNFHLTVDRNVGGVHPVSATCEDGKVRVYVVGRFEDGSRATSEINRPCRPGAN